MRIIETKVFSFNELNEDAKEKAIQNLYDINRDFEWWEFTYYDAKEIGLKITSFDLDRNRHAKGEFIFEVKEVINAILSNHGKSCDTYKVAENYKEEIFNLIEKEENLDFRNYDLEGQISDLENEFLQVLLEEYSIILQRECEYLQSKEAIIESIIANNYEFTEGGELI
jgi:hypothetical protein